MNEEEKKAIEEIRKIRDRYLHTFCDELTILLNLIKKLQREIEELKQNQCNHNISNECVLKQKIKDKIEELNIRITDLKYFDDTGSKIAISEYQERIMLYEELL